MGNLAPSFLARMSSMRYAIAMKVLGVSSKSYPQREAVNKLHGIQLININLPA